MGRSPEALPGSTLAKLAMFSGGVAFFLGALGLVGWITGSRILASLRSEYIPMAPDTGVLFLMLGGTLLFGACKKGRGPVRSLAVSLAGLASFYGALKTVETVLGVDLSFQRVLFPGTERLGPIALGRMSPVTGLLFFLSGFALLACLLSRSRRLPREAASDLGLVVLVVGGIAVTGYLFGTPLLYGGRTIPLAATTSGAFFFLGLGVVATAGRETRVARALSGPSGGARLLRGILPIIVLAILLEGILVTRLAGVLGVNQALVSAVLTLVFMSVTVVIVVRIARSVFRRAEEAEAERRGAEEQLLIKEAALASSMSAIGLASMDGILIYANKAYIDLWGGGRADDLLGKPLTNFSGHEEAVREVVDALMAGKGYVGEKVARLKDGREHVIQLTANVVTSPDGRPMCMMSSFLDVTERRRAEDALRLSEERYRTLFENDHAVMMIIDPDSGAIIDANPAAAAFYGWTRDELRGMNIGRINTLPPEEVAAEMRRARLEQRRQFFFRHRRADGTIRNVEVFSGPITLEDRSLLYSIVHDVTERARAEEALSRSEERFRQIAENEGDFIWEVDADGLYTYANPVVEKILGYRPEELVGKLHFYDLFSPDIRVELKEGAMAAFAAKASFQAFVNPNLRKDGARVILETSGARDHRRVGRAPRLPRVRQGYHRARERRRKPCGIPSSRRRS